MEDHLDSATCVCPFMASSSTTRSCPACAALLPASALKCGVCGKTFPPTAGASPARRQPTGGQHIDLICPGCRRAAPASLSGHANGNIQQCTSCNIEFSSCLYTVRAKRSRGDRQAIGGLRHFDIRVIDSAKNEHLIQFDNADWNDFELRAKDQVVFTYLNGELRLVQNLTIGVYYLVRRPKCFIASHLYGPDSAQVATLRRFRDQYLMRSPVGATCVRFYYRTSPFLVGTLGGSRIGTSILRSIVSLGLWMAHQRHLKRLVEIEL